MARVIPFNRDDQCVMQHAIRGEMDGRVWGPMDRPPEFRVCGTRIGPTVIEQACPCGEVIWRREVPQLARGLPGFFRELFGGAPAGAQQPPYPEQFDWRQTHAAQIAQYEQAIEPVRQRLEAQIQRQFEEQLRGAMADPLFAHGLNPATNPSTPPETKASAKARELLRQKLTVAQQRTFDKYGVFFVIGPSGAMYKVTRLGVELDNGGRKESLCVYPKDKHEIPIWDTMLAQKLAIEADEEEFLKTANHFPR